ncbi:gamma-glutamylcyclotransferase family protein [Ferrovibrio xuzhouensis]|uniref:Putative gamma-glutamylcyclotransferase n=1 Tax=Ferrovibrio xuzhouensis TaxID=1576914 RepID=A0ABV7VIE0_9PROT
MSYFFYGTLCDPDVLRLVLGYRPSRRQFTPAILTGFRRKIAKGRRYPVLVPAPAGCIRGLVFQPGRPRDHERLAAYEGPDYAARRLPVRRLPDHEQAAGRACVFVAARSPRGGSCLPADFADWHPQQWQRRDKRRFLQSLLTQGPVPCAHP